MIERFFCFICVIFLTACTVSERVVNEDGEGRIPDTVFDNLKNNRTEKEWVIRMIGNPDYFEEYSQNVEIFTYQYSRAQYKHASAFFVFRYNAVERNDEYLHLILKDDVLQKHWVDEFPTVQKYVLKSVYEKKKSLIEILKHRFSKKDIDQKNSDTSKGSKVETQDQRHKPDNNRIFNGQEKPEVQPEIQELERENDEASPQNSSIKTNLKSSI